MSNITLNELSRCKELNAKQLAVIAGGLTPDLQFRLNQFGANLFARSQILFNPHYIYNTIRTSQQAHRALYGRQMPWNFRLSWM